jgi:Fe2+ or Zn2+ uptake regulation protein
MDFVEELKRRGLKVTPQRIAVLRIISQGGHFSGEQIYDTLKKNEPSISLSTVYNTLETLKQTGLLRSFEANGVTWYEVNKGSHVNVFCTDTNTIIDANVDLKSIEDKLEEMGFKVSMLSVIAYAECKEVRRRKVVENQPI